MINMASAKAFRWTSLLALAVLLVVPALAVGQTLVQQNSNTFDPNNPNLGAVSVSFPNPETATNLTVVVVGWSDTSSTVASVTDDGGNSYQLAAGTNASSCCSQAIYFAKNIKVAQTITVNFNQVASAPDVRIREYSGLDTTQPLDTSAGVPGSSGTPGFTADSGLATTTNATDLIVGAGTISSYFTGGGTGFGNVLVTPHFSDVIEDRNVSTAGPHNATAAVGGAGNWAMQMAAFSTVPITSSLPTVAAVTPNSGADVGAEAVAITGTNIEPGAVVFFDGESAVNCTWKSTTEIDCLTPSHSVASNITVAVQNVDGQSGSLTSAFSYTKSTPVVNGVTPGQGATNGGNQVTISGSSFFGPASVSIAGLPASNVTVVNSTTITASAPAHAVGAVDVTVTNGDGGVSAPLAAGYTYVLGTGPVNFIQAGGTGASTGTHSTATVIMPNPQTVGDWMVVVVGWGDTTSDVASVTDDGNNTYTRALATFQNAAGNISQTIYYGKVAASGTTLTVTFNLAAGAPDVRVMEYRGLDPTHPLDTSTSAAASTKSTVNGIVATGGAVSTTFTNNVIVAGAMVGQTVVGTGNNFVATAITKDGNGAAHRFNPSAISGAFATFNIKPSAPWIVQEVTFHASASAPQPNFTLGASPSSASVAAGSSATYSISATGQDNFSSAVSLSCSGPAGVGISCSVSPSSITPGGAPATLTVTTTGPTAALYAPQRNKMLPLYAIWLPLPGMALAGIGYASRKRKLAIGMTLFLVLGLTLLLAGCGGGGSSSGGGGGGGGGGGTTAGTYTITVTGASGSLNHSTQVTLTVQ